MACPYQGLEVVSSINVYCLGNGSVKVNFTHSGCDGCGWQGRAYVSGDPVIPDFQDLPTSFSFHCCDGKGVLYNIRQNTGPFLYHWPWCQTTYLWTGCMRSIMGIRAFLDKKSRKVRIALTDKLRRLLRTRKLQDNKRI